MLIPIPFELAKNENFVKIFGLDSVDHHFCTVREVRKNRTVIEIEKEDVGYRIEMWDTLHNVINNNNLEEQLKSSSTPEVYSEIQNLYVNRPILNREHTEVSYCSETFVAYEEGSAGWLSELFDPLFQEELTIGLFRGFVASWKVSVL